MKQNPFLKIIHEAPSEKQYHYAVDSDLLDESRIWHKFYF